MEVIIVSLSTTSVPHFVICTSSLSMNGRSECWLTAGMTMSASTTNSEPGTVLGLRRPPSSNPFSSIRMHLTPVTRAVADELDGGDEREDLDALLERLLDLARVGGHVVDLAAVEHRHLLRAEAQGGAGRVEGGAAAADDDDVPADLDLPAEVHLAQERHAVIDAVLVLAGHLDLVRELRAGGDVDRLVALRSSSNFTSLPTSTSVWIFTPTCSIIRISLARISRETVLGDARDEHSARDGQRLVDGHVVAEARQVVPAGQARGAGADDADRLAFFGNTRSRCGSSLLKT